MNETPVKHLNGEGYDILVLFDYRDVSFNLSQFDEFMDIFAYCDSLKTIEIGPNINIIPRGFLYECKSLESVTIPSQVKRFEVYAFEHSKNLKYVYGINMKSREKLSSKL